MSETGFRRLSVWRKAQDLALEVCALVDDLPRKRSAEILGAQVLRSAVSVPANIAEGYGRYSAGAYRNHLSIARGSLMETESHIDLLASAGLVSTECAERLISLCQEVGKLLTTHMKSFEGRSIREDGPEYEA